MAIIKKAWNVAGLEEEIEEPVYAVRERKEKNLFPMSVRVKRIYDSRERS